MGEFSCCVKSSDEERMDLFLVMRELHKVVWMRSTDSLGGWALVDVPKRDGHVCTVFSNGKTELRCDINVISNEREYRVRGV